jgi:hypothetical protein
MQRQGCDIFGGANSPVFLFFLTAAAPCLVREAVASCKQEVAVPLRLSPSLLKI